MFVIKQGKQTAVLVIVLLSGLYAQPPEEHAKFGSELPRPDLVNHEYIKVILNKMAVRGDQYLNDSNISENQILVIAVFSAEKVDSQNQDISDDMIKFLPNKEIIGLPEYYYSRKKTVHGEIQAIYFNNTIDDLLGEPRNSSMLPYVFIFSHYIPCACLPNYYYSCAEELANLGRVNRNRYKIIVGFRSVWSRTNSSFAKNFLQEDGIHTVMNITSGRLLDKGPKIDPENGSAIYQKTLNECMTNKTGMLPNSAACFINGWTKHCTGKKDRFHGKYLFGYMTRFTKAQMHECMEEWVKSLTNKSKPSEEYIKSLKLELYARHCSLKTLRSTLRLMLGRPFSWCEATWNRTEDDLKWNDLYDLDDSPDFTSMSPEFASNLRSSTVFGEILKECKEYIKQSENRSFPRYLKAKMEELKKDIENKKSNITGTERNMRPQENRERKRKDNQEKNSTSGMHSRERHKES